MNNVNRTKTETSNSDYETQSKGDFREIRERYQCSVWEMNALDQGDQR